MLQDLKTETSGNEEKWDPWNLCGGNYTQCVLTTSPYAATTLQPTLQDTATLDAIPCSTRKVTENSRLISRIL
jgi:hypothetical protein